jgi:signal transduction histidine kinase
MHARVFVVDDDPLAATELAAQIARDTGFEVESFVSAREALAAAGHTPPDAVLAGLRMSEMSGPDLIRAVRDLDPELAALLVTSASDADATAEAVGLVGPLGHVHKPFERGDLLPKLMAALERRQLILDLQAMQTTLDQRDRALRASRRDVARTEAELQSTSTDLETATERLVKAEQLAAVGRVLAGVAHELDRQLALVGYAEAIKSRVADDAELVELADIIVNAQKRLAIMVDEIRDFVSGSLDHRPGGEIDREPADLAAVIDEALNIMRFDPDVRLRQLERAYHGRPLVMLHRQKFSQVVLNLVSNAVLATHAGDTVVVELDEYPRRGVAVVTVADRGTGMPEEVLRRLGEPFFTTRGDRGSGLGVGVCRRIVEEHGGTLAFESEVGVGTTARVTLPLIQDLDEPVGGER